MKPTQTTLQFETLGIDKEKFTVDGVFSTDDTDRHGDVVKQDGWLLENYMKNPVILFGHNHWDLPIGKMIKLSVEEKDGKSQLVGTIQFAAEEYELAKTIFNLYAGGYMKAFSVGFRNLERSRAVRPAEEGDDSEERERSYSVLEVNELFEVSAVPIPANANALVKAAEDGVELGAYKKGLENLVDTKMSIFSSEHERTIVDAMDAIKQFADTMKDTQATDTAVETKSAASTSPRSKGSDQAKAKASPRLLRAKAVHRVNRAIRVMAKVKKSL